MIEINNIVKVPIKEKLFKQVGEEILDKENIQEKVDISVAIVKEQDIKTLNKIYRDKDEPTDVLSFAENSNFIFPIEGTKQLGEIIICPSQVKKAKEKISEVFIHGLLHLLGYTHKFEKDSIIMEAKQKKYLTFFKKYGSE